MVLYLRDVISLKLLLNRDMPRHGFLFADNKGPWNADKISKIFIREIRSQIGFRMTSQEYRHIAIAIDRKFIRGIVAEEEDINDDDDDEMEDAHDLMSAHSRRIAEARYARVGGLTKNLTSESIELFRNISDKWQCWFNLLSRQPKDIKGVTMIAVKEDSTEEKVTKALYRLYGASGE
jgi:hypothetical protein